MNECASDEARAKKQGECARDYVRVCLCILRESEREERVREERE